MRRLTHFLFISFDFSLGRGILRLKGIDPCEITRRDRVEKGRQAMKPGIDRSVRDDADSASIEELEAAEQTLDRVLVGGCQNCGKKEGCTCKFIG